MDCLPIARHAWNCNRAAAASGDHRYPSYGVRLPQALLCPTWLVAQRTIWGVIWCIHHSFESSTRSWSTCIGTCMYCPCAYSCALSEGPSSAHHIYHCWWGVRGPSTAAPRPHKHPSVYTTEQGRGPCRRHHTHSRAPSLTASVTRYTMCAYDFSTCSCNVSCMCARTLLCGY